MKRSEWVGLVEYIEASWPHAEVPDDALAKWYDDLKGYPVEQVQVAIESYYRDGREFPPNGGQLIARICELQRDDPDHGKAWALAMKAVKGFGNYQGIEAIKWLQERSPAVALAVERFGFHDLCMVDLDDEATVRAQFREIYKAVVAERQRDAAYAGLPDAGLRSLKPGPHKPAFGEVAGDLVQLEEAGK